jgi:hypothetical protein
MTSVGLIIFVISHAILYLSIDFYFPNWLEYVCAIGWVIGVFLMLIGFVEFLWRHML